MRGTRKGFGVADEISYGALHNAGAICLNSGESCSDREARAVPLLRLAARLVLLVERPDFVVEGVVAAG